MQFLGRKDGMDPRPASASAARLVCQTESFKYPDSRRCGSNSTQISNSKRIQTKGKQLPI
eukprot:scaffold614728_cov30-Prasinocladus_malaysianus.AAC.1